MLLNQRHFVLYITILTPSASPMYRSDLSINLLLRRLNQEEVMPSVVINPAGILIGVLKGQRTVPVT